MINLESPTADTVDLLKEVVEHKRFFGGRDVPELSTGGRFDGWCLPCQWPLDSDSLSSMATMPWSPGHVLKWVQAVGWCTLPCPTWPIFPPQYLRLLEAIVDLPRYPVST